MEDKLQKLAKKSIAVSSGKGGVGKTTTAVNLAIFMARRNYKVCLIDIDPLSDVTTLLDIKEPVHIIQETLSTAKTTRLDNYICNAFVNIDILFPLSKLKKHDSQIVFNKIYGEYTEELVARYDLIIFDMPAGIREEDNLAFLPYVSSLVLVTNAEPAAHFSAGGYLKIAKERCPELPVYIWHNKYEKDPGSEFNPTDVIGNYNRFSPEEGRIDRDQIKGVFNHAFIPRDPSMDLLQTNPAVTLNIQRSLVDQLEFLKEERLKELAVNCSIPPQTVELLKFYMVHTSSEETVKEFIIGLAKYVYNFMYNKIGKIPTGENIFTDEQIESFTKLYLMMRRDPLYTSIIKLIDTLYDSIIARENEKRMFFVGNTSTPNKAVDLAMSSLLIQLNTRAENLSPVMRNISGLLLFYFALYKLFQSEGMLQLMNNFIPVRRNQKGRTVRDKRRQIRNLVEKNELYRQSFFDLLKKLFPVISRQLSHLVKIFKLPHLYLKDKKGGINKDAYVKLFSHFLHDTLNSGLGIITNFNFRPSAMAFHDGAEGLLKKLNLPSKKHRGKAGSIKKTAGSLSKKRPSFKEDRFIRKPQPVGLKKS